MDPDLILIPQSGYSLEVALRLLNVLVIKHD